jgi:hypothetical protein
MSSGQGVCVCVERLRIPKRSSMCVLRFPKSWIWFSLRLARRFSGRSHKGPQGGLKGAKEDQGSHEAPQRRPKAAPRRDKRSLTCPLDPLDPLECARGCPTATRPPLFRGTRTSYIFELPIYRKADFAGQYLLYGTPYRIPHGSAPSNGLGR